MSGRNRSARMARSVVGAALMASVVATAASAAEDTLVIAIPSFPQGLDLDKDSSPQTWNMAAQVYEQGMYWEKVAYPYDAETPPEFSPNQVPDFGYPGFRDQVMTPGIVEACELSEDSKTATYKLRQGVISAYGNEFDSDDVLWRVERASATKAIDFFLQSLANVADPKKWSAVDKYTVQITSDTPIPLACPMLTNIYYPFWDADEARKHISDGDPWGDKWISTNGGGFGAYYVTSWEPGKRVVMEANPNYWGDELAIKKIVYVVVPEAASRLALLQRGEVHVAETMSPDDLRAVVGSETSVAVAVKGNQAIFANINNAKPPFDNVKVRQAVNMLIPRDDIVASVYGGLAKSWSGVMPSGFPGAADLAGYKYDPEAAKALLAESGVDLSQPIPLSLNAADAVQENIAILLQRSFAEAGITLELKKLPVAALSDEVYGKSGSLSLWVDMAIQPDPSYALGLFYQTGGATNFSSYSNAEVDKLLDAGRYLVGQARIDAHQSVQKIIQDEAATGWIAEQYFTLAISKKLKGLNWSPAQYYRIREMSFVE